MLIFLNTKNSTEYTLNACTFVIHGMTTNAITHVFVHGRLCLQMGPSNFQDLFVKKTREVS